jgi:hypothetical protein
MGFLFFPICLFYLCFCRHYYDFISRPVLSTELRSQLQMQLAYYFSESNLRRDRFLRSQMDGATGSVPIALIAGFPKVRALCEAAPGHAAIDVVAECMRGMGQLSVDSAGAFLILNYISFFFFFLFYILLHPRQK